MPLPAIFNTGEFEVTSLTAAINDAPYAPGRLAQLGWFRAQGISTLNVMIEKRDQGLALVENRLRGSSGTVVVGDKRKALSFMATHLPERATLMADEVQGVRAFGSNSSTEALTMKRDERLATMRRNIDVTHEWHRIGALKGKVYDSDAATVIYDLFTAFGLSQQSVGMALGTSTTSIRAKCNQILTKMESALGNIPFTSARVLCGASFWEAFITHEMVEKTFLNQAAANDLRTSDPRGSLSFGGLLWERYRGKVGSQAYIADDEAYAVPEGVADLFVSYFAPADYMETVNTIGLPYYARAEALEFNKGILLEAQSNPVHLCTRPDAIIKLTKT